MGMFKSLFIRYLGQLFVFSVIILGGAYIFMILERSAEELNEQRLQKLNSTRVSLIQKYNISEKELDDYVEQKVEVHDLQLEVNLLDGMNLCFSIAFTTGWGHVLPTTNSSKIFFFFYSCVSISMATVLLKTISDILILLICQSIEKIEERLFGYSSCNGLQLKCAGLAVFIMLIFMIFTALTLQQFSGISWLDAFYIAFQSYTTIGFGDLSHKTHPARVQTYQVLVMLGLNTVGMALLATIVNALVRLEFKGAKMSLKKLSKTFLKDKKTNSDEAVNARVNENNEIDVSLEL